ncbi:MAG: type IX secretion system sortase PorU [Bacteroidota bacterium]|nr:type IX secretion system sortase PorU [Bacteroidota bacterium]
MIKYKITTTLNKGIRVLLTSISLFLLYNVTSAQSFEKEYQITWQGTSLQAAELIYISPKDNCPYLYISEKAGVNKKLEASIKNIEYENVDTKVSSDIKWLLVNTLVQFKKIIIRKENYTVLDMPAIRKNPSSGELERIKKIQIAYTIQNDLPQITSRGNKWKSQSELATGDCYKIQIFSNAVYKMDYQFLKNLGVNIDQIDPRNIKMFGNGGGMLPQQNNAKFNDDLEEIAITVMGEQDGKFDNDDYLMFYGKGQNVWNYDTAENRFLHQQNYYSDGAFYFISVGNTAGKRIQGLSIAAGALPSLVNSFDERLVHELDLENPFKSGRVFLGEKFDKTVDYNFNETLSGIINSEDIIITSEVNARSFANSSMGVLFNGQNIIDHQIPYTYPDQGANYYTTSNITKHTKIASEQVSLRYNYAKPMMSSAGWLNYYEIQYRRSLNFAGGMLFFRDSRSYLSLTGMKFEINNGGDANVWDVSNQNNIQKVNYINQGGKAVFYQNENVIHEYVVFDASSLKIPSAVGKVANQNLHALGQHDFVIISHPDFVAQSNRLAEYRRGQGMRVVVVTPKQLYNEFSSGAQDISAFRNFMKMLYDRAGTPDQMPKNLLLVGDASFDYKNDKVVHDNGGKLTYYSNTNFVPTFESDDSYSQASHCSDDYYGFLDDGEGDWLDYAEFGLDIGVGRLPVNTEAQAREMVDKIIIFESNKSFGDWRTKSVILGDDQDQNSHLKNAEDVSGNIENNCKEQNVKKLYFDAYKKVIDNGVPSYPDVKNIFNTYLQRGCMFVNYSGHGGPAQWAHENIFNIDQIKNLRNINNLPVFMAATCDFAPWDDPTITSAGEWVVLNPNGGGIAILSTTRIANTGQNQPVNANFFNNNVFERNAVSGKFRTLGEAYMYMKKAAKGIRNFMLLGDPSLNLMIPTDTVVITNINGKAAGNDTLKALMQVTIAGEIRDRYNNLEANFNGFVYPTIYDKRSPYQTLGNEPTSNITTFTEQNNIIYKGKATVQNGKYSFSFIVPKDINYKTGFGKLSFYAHSDTKQAWGANNAIALGGTSDSIIPDSKGPEILVYMNDDKWVTGGTTNANPLMYVKLFDESGINTSGSGVGRNLTATLDDGKSFVVNDFYVAQQNDFTHGEVRYPMANVGEGKHTLTFKAWDVYNNSSTSSTEFYVVNDINLSISHLLNYPNPFFTLTTFHFDHNKAGQALNVQIQIMNVSGQVVKNLQTSFEQAPSHFEHLTWDGCDEYGDKIGRGVYIYRLCVSDGQGNTVNQTQKLVVLQ